MVFPGAAADVNMAAPNSKEQRELFEIFNLKVTQCAKKYVHDWSSCPFAHTGERARRRDPRKYNYQSIACMAMKQDGTCLLGDLCRFSHNAWEFWLHPQRYHTALCGQGPGCQRKICFFAHSVEELKQPAGRSSGSQLSQQDVASFSCCGPEAMPACTPVPRSAAQPCPTPRAAVAALPMDPFQQAPASSPPQQLLGRSPPRGLPAAWQPSNPSSQSSHSGGSMDPQEGGSTSGSTTSSGTSSLLGGVTVPLEQLPLGGVGRAVGAASAPLPSAVGSSNNVEPTTPPGQQGNRWPSPPPQLQRLPTPAASGQGNAFTAPIPTELVSPQQDPFSQSSKQGEPAPGSLEAAVFQAVAGEVAAGRSTAAQAASLLGQLMPTQSLVQLALAQGALGAGALAQAQQLVQAQHAQQQLAAGPGWQASGAQEAWYGGATQEVAGAGLEVAAGVWC